jgi:hypothetical protein
MVGPNSDILTKLYVFFIYRVETIGWISKLKFEEIWMAFLGILNLNNEDQVRPEEQASVIQVINKTKRVFYCILSIIITAGYL